MKKYYKLFFTVFIAINFFKILLLPFFSNAFVINFLAIGLAFVVYFLSLKFNKPFDFSKNENADERTIRVVDKSSTITLIIMLILGYGFSVFLRINNMIEARGILSIFVILGVGVYIATTLIMDRLN